MAKFERQEWCKNNHYMEDTRYTAPDGKTYCRECARIKRRKKRQAVPSLGHWFTSGRWKVKRDDKGRFIKNPEFVGDVH